MDSNLYVKTQHYSTTKCGIHAWSKSVPESQKFLGGDKKLTLEGNE